MLLYRFDNVNEYPVLESKTTVRGRVTTAVEGSGDHVVLRVAAARQPPDLARPTVVLALPLRAIVGEPQQFFLELCGDAGGSQISLEAADAGGVGLVYTFGAVDFAGWRTCAADATRPSERWDSQDPAAMTHVASPLHLYRLSIALGASREAMDLRFRALGVSGEVRFAVPGIA